MLCTLADKVENTPDEQGIHSVWLVTTLRHMDQLGKPNGGYMAKPVRVLREESGEISIVASNEDLWRRQCLS